MPDIPEDPRPTLGIGMVGDGLMAKEHSMAWRNVEAVYGSVPYRPQLVALMHPTAHRAASAAARYGFERSSTSWRDIVESDDIDVIDIVTPNAAHAEVAIAAAEAGKHIWCEKPLAVTVEEGEAMTAAAEKAGVTTLVGFTYLHNPAVSLAKSLVEAGQLGEIISFDGTFLVDTMIDPAIPHTWRTDRSLAGGGALGDLGSHMVALAHHVVGQIDRVSGLSRTVITERNDASGLVRTVDNDDIATALLEFDDGFTGTLQASRVSTGRAFEVAFTVTGTHGSIRFDQQTSHHLEVSLASDGLDTHGFRTIEVGPGHGDFGELWPMSGINIGLHELKIFEVQRFITALDSGVRVLPDFREALDVQRVIDAIERSAESRDWTAVDR